MKRLTHGTRLLILAVLLCPAIAHQSAWATTENADSHSITNADMSAAEPDPDSTISQIPPPGMATIVTPAAPGEPAVGRPVVMPEENKSAVAVAVVVPDQPTLPVVPPLDPTNATVVPDQTTNATVIADEPQAAVPAELTETEKVLQQSATQEQAAPSQTVPASSQNIGRYSWLQPPPPDIAHESQNQRPPVAIAPGGWNPPNNVWQWQQRQPPYYAAQRFYWQQCAGCHGFLPPAAIPAFLRSQPRYWPYPPPPWAGQGMRQPNNWQPNNWQSNNWQPNNWQAGNQQPGNQQPGNQPKNNFGMERGCRL